MICETTWISKYKIRVVREIAPASKKEEIGVALLATTVKRGIIGRVQE